MRSFNCRSVEKRMSSVLSCFRVTFVLDVTLCRSCCLVVRCWLGFRCCADGGRGSCWLVESATFHSIPFRVVFRHGEPNHVARELVVVSVGSVWLQIDVGVVFSISWLVFLESGALLAWLILLCSSCRHELGPAALRGV